MNVVEKTNLLSSLVLPSEAVARKEAKLALEKMGLPTAKTEEYKYTAITRLLEKHFESLTPTPIASDIALDDFLIKDLDAHILVFINGVFCKQHSSFDSQDVSIRLLNNEAEAEEKAITYTDPFALLNEATHNHGVLIEVKSNVEVSKPLVIHHVSDARKAVIVTASRNTIKLDKSSQVSIIEKYDSVGGVNFSTSVNEITVAENAGLTYTLIQNDAGQRIQFNQTTIHQQRNSRVDCFTLSLNGKLIRNNLNLIIDGEGVDSHMNGLYLLTGDTIADNHTVVDHRKAHSQSNELYKGVMDGNSKGVFNGKIYVRPDAQKTNAFQSNRNILLSDKATVNTKPQLEIWADDVKCSHGCTSGQLDEEALFYLQSRGINKDSARALLLYAYAGEVIDKISNESLRTYIDALVSERLHKNF